MNKLLLVIAILLFSLKSFSQNSAHVKQLSFSTGPSFAAAPFSNHTLTDEKAGFAKTGMTLQAAYYHPLMKGLGLMATLGGQFNPINTAAMEQAFGEATFAGMPFFTDTPIPPPGPGPGTRYENWQFEKNAWWSGSLLLGVYSELPLSTQSPFSLRTHLSAGASYITAPSVEGSSISSNKSAHFEQTGGNAIAFAYSAATGIKYDTKARVDLMLMLEYFGSARAKFNDVTATFTSMQGTPGQPGFVASQSMQTGDTQQGISSVNLCLGVLISL